MNPKKSFYQFTAFFLITSIVILGIFIVPPSAKAAILNLVGNAGFELDLGGAVATNNWNSEANRGVVQVTGGAPQGAKFLRLSEPTVIAGTPGVFTFQTVTGIRESDVVAFNGLVRVTALDGGDAAQLRLEFQNEAGTVLSATNTSVSTITATFSRAVVSAVAPAGTFQVAAVIRIQPSAVGGTSIAEFDDMQFTANASPLFLEAHPASTSIPKGGAKMISLRLQNLSGDSLTLVNVTVEPPAGINVRSEKGNLDGSRLDYKEGSVIYNVGTMTAGQESILSFPIVVTSGAVPGKSYDIAVKARASTGLGTNTLHIRVRVENDPVFDEGTILGKVFNDLNQNGIQEKGEKGVPFVRLVTEEGITLITDEHGRYSLPAVSPGRHLVKIDGHTLPEGTKFITEESYLVKITPGLMAKANFAVLIPPSEISGQFAQDLMASVTQGLDTSRPDLSVVMVPDVVGLGVKRFQKDPVFQFKMNYPEYIKNWYLEIRDEMGRPAWVGFGLGAPPSEVVWRGETESGDFINPGVYSYQLKVEDQKGYQDWTPLHFFRVLSPHQAYDEDRYTSIPSIGDFNIFKDGKRSISLVAKPTLQIQGRTKKGRKVFIGDYPVEVNEDGIFNVQTYTTPGEKEITVTATSPEGENTTLVKKVTVKDSTFFMVALAEGQGGVNFNRGNIETVGRDESFRDGFYQDGRMSYYLRGKIKGKFLVKSHYNSEDKRSALFTNLDQDNYYPIYGDHSIRDYEGQDTLERFYMVVEMDRSFAKIGSFETAFNDTELSTYNRTLSGFKLHHESMSTTQYGDTQRGFTVYSANTRSRADHNEFLATGGSLYYLRYRSVIQGSEKIRIEVRDRIQDMSVESIELQEGIDYEIDYPEGRIILTKPLSSIAASDTLVSHDILDGNPVFLMVDYEYDAGADAFEDKNRGFRGFTQVGDHIRVGATAVEEKRQVGDYDLRGLDITTRVGRNTKITAEYAETQLKQTDVGLSYNGGLSFANLDPIDAPQATHPRENAMLLKVETKPVQNLETSAYVQVVDPGFSTERIRSQEGFRKYGLANKLKLSEDFYLRQRFDVSDAENELNPPQLFGFKLPYESLRTNTVQAIFDNDHLLAEAEYRHQFSDIPRDALSPTLLSEIPFRDGIAAKVGYHFNDRLLPYVKAQAGFNDKANHQFGAGIRYQVTQSLFGFLEQMVGTIGDSTRFGFEKFQDNTRSYAGLKMLDFGNGIRNMSTSIGSSKALSERSRIYSEREFSSFGGQDGYANIVGYDTQINDRWSFEAKGERRHLDSSTTRLLDNQAESNLIRVNAYNSISSGVAYRNGKKLNARTALEFRRDSDNPELSQWLAQNNVTYEINQDLSFLGKLNYGRSRFLNPNDTTAAFTELSAGFAYRPVENDKLNVLTRYSLLRNISNDFQFQNAIFGNIESDETAHMIAIDLAYDLYKTLGMVNKFAYKHTTLLPNVTEEVILHHILAVQRFNFHVTRKWDVGIEYRGLWQLDAARTMRHGALTEIDRELYDYVRLGVGYNFTDFDDDLRKVNDFRSHGPFVRMTGKF